MSEEVLEEKKELELGAEVPAIDVGELDESILHARDLMRTFVKTIKAFRLYPPENPTVLGFRDQVIHRFHQFLNQYQSFAFQIGEYNLTYKGKVLYENEDVKTSLAYLLYKDGLRELRFNVGLEDAELMELIDLIKRGDLINELEDDLVTLIWEKDFEHISYLATDEYMEDMPVIIPESVDEFRQNLVLDPLAQNVDTDLDEEEGPGFDFFENLAKRVQSPPEVATNHSVYILSAEEMDGLRKEVEAEVSPNSLFNVVDVLFEIMALGKEPESYQNAANVLQKMLDALLVLGEFQRAADLLSRINIMLNMYELKDWQVKILEGIIQKAGDAQRMEQIGKVLDSGENIRVDDVSKYLILLQPNAIPSIVEVLGTVNSSKSRRVLCNALCVLGKNHIELLTPFMDDSRWFLVRNVTYVLGRIGKEQSLPIIQKAFTHKEARVRREAVQAMGLIGSPRVFGLLAKALTDADGRIRGTAALNLARVGKKDSLPYLLEVAQSKDFPKREAGERKAFADAINMVSGLDSRIPQKPAEAKAAVETNKPEAKGTPVAGKKGEIRRETLRLRAEPEEKAIPKAAPSPASPIAGSSSVSPSSASQKASVKTEARIAPAPSSRNPHAVTMARRRVQTGKRASPPSGSGQNRFFKKCFTFFEGFKRLWVFARRSMNLGALRK